MNPPDPQVFTLGCYTLHATGLTVQGRPTFDEHEDVGRFIQSAHKRSGFWLADHLRYGDSRTDWQQMIDQIVDVTGMSAKTAKNVRAVGAIPQSRRRADVEFGHHEAVAALPDDEQTHWLAEAASHGWNVRDLRLNIRASRRRKVLEGQAKLEGQYRVLLCDPPWTYGNKPPSGSGSSAHYPTMSMKQIADLPVAAHARPDAVLFLWVTSPMLFLNPGPRDILEAWGFHYKASIVWDKVNHGFGNYVSIRHEFLLIATRGKCTPDRPTPMYDSVITERQEGEHSAKPESVRKMIERLYDGPYVELFARERAPNWDAFGNDAKLWASDQLPLLKQA